jgi:hypothetical protein
MFRSSQEQTIHNLGGDIGSMHSSDLIKIALNLDEVAKA